MSWHSNKISCWKSHIYEIKHHSERVSDNVKHYAEYYQRVKDLKSLKEMLNILSAFLR